jgi:hypothetical protein
MADQSQSLARGALAAAADEPDIDALVEDLRGVCDAAGTMLMVKVGKLVLERIYGGDIERWHSHGRKNASFRKLARHPRLPFSRANLSRAVGIYVLSLRRPEVLGLHGIGPCHLREIVGLDAAAQDALLALTVEHEWSVCHLHDEVCQLKKDAAKGESVSIRLAFAGLLQTWHADVEASGFLQDIERLDDLEPNEATELLETAKHLAQQLETLIQQLARRVDTRPERPTDTSVPNRVTDQRSGTRPAVTVSQRVSRSPGDDPPPDPAE